MTDTNYEHGLTTEEEQLGLAPLLVGVVDFCVDALPPGTVRDLDGRNAKRSAMPFDYWRKPDGSVWKAEDFRDHLTRYIEDRCEFTPSRKLLAYLSVHVLAPYFTRDELVRFINHRLEQRPGSRVDLEDLYLKWRKMAVRDKKWNNPGITFRTFKASEADWRRKLEERGFELSGDALLGWAWRAKAPHWSVRKKQEAEANRSDEHGCAGSE